MFAFCSFTSSLSVFSVFHRKDLTLGESNQQIHDFSERIIFESKDTVDLCKLIFGISKFNVIPVAVVCM